MCMALFMHAFFLRGNISLPRFALFNCIKEWIKKNKNAKTAPTCPMCRVEIDLDKLVNTNHVAPGVVQPYLDDEGIDAMFGIDAEAEAKEKAEKQRKIEELNKENQAIPLSARPGINADSDAEEMPEEHP